MIELRNVTKIYKVKKKKDVTAINNLSLVLPDKGMVFIIGKSGSGKSTLLNMIGGLDKVTNGDIIVNGNLITKMKKRELTKYRSSHIGFIFQDYHVLNNLTVKQNIELALDINNNTYEHKIDDIIKHVDMNEFASRYPSELSGGQKQRIAVARALVKDASVILCDEPTGNLDSKTTRQILELLKKISQHKLVVIVSHNIRDAQNYGDRIIELYDGQIFSDKERDTNYNNEFKIENNVIYLPHFNDLTPTELIMVNDKIEHHNSITFKQIGNQFYNTKIEPIEQEQVVIPKSKLSSKGSRKLYKLLFKKKVAFFFNIFIVAVLLVCFAVFQFFLNFKSNEELSKSLSKHNISTVPLLKGKVNSEGSLSVNGVNKVTDADIQAFRDSGYKEDIYVKYNNTIPIMYYTFNDEEELVISHHFGMLYCGESLGTINAKEKMVIDNYDINNDGKIDYHCIASETKDYGVYITDYLADSILFYNKDLNSYDDLLGVYEYQKSKVAYINGIIKTNYREKYSDLFNEFDSCFKNNQMTAFYTKVKDSDEYATFLMEAINFLAYGYSFVDDYENAIQTLDYKKSLRLNDFMIKLKEEDQSVITNSKSFIHSNDLKENEIQLSPDIFNSLFGSNYTSSSVIEPVELTFYFYESTPGESQIIYEKTFIMNSFSKDDKNRINFNYSFDLFEYDIIKYGVYLSNHNDIANMVNIATENNFVINSIDATKLATINRVLEVFGKFFTFIELFFLALTVIFIFNMGKQGVKKNKYEIGVLMSIGVNNFSIIKQYMKQCIILCVTLCIMSYIGIYIGSIVSNAILVKAFELVLDTSFFDLKLINFMPNLVLKDLSLIIIITIGSYLLPQLLLLRIRPIDIIRARE